MQLQLEHRFWKNVTGARFENGYRITGYYLTTLVALGNDTSGNEKMDTLSVILGCNQ